MLVAEQTEAAWDAFVDASPQGMVYLKSFYLRCHDLPVRYWSIRKGEDAVGGFAAVESPRGIVPLAYQHYNGLIFRRFDDCKRVTETSLRYEAATCAAEFLFGRYGEVHLLNHWDVVDMRPFQWVNYHDRQAGYFEVQPRYTALLDITTPDDATEYQTLRRRSLKKAEDAKLETRASDDYALLDHLQARTYEHQDVKRPENQGAMTKRIAAALGERGAGVVYVTYQDNRPLAAALFAVDSHRAYFVAGGHEPDDRNLNAGTKLMVDAFRHLRQERGVTEVDFVGANSPNRGAFKLSFGARLVPFFAVGKMQAAAKPMSGDSSEDTAEP